MGATFVTIQGNLTEDPTYNNYPPSTTQLTRFRLAASKRRKTDDKDDSGKEIWVESDHLYIDVKCWGKLANNCRMSLRRGHPVTVTGKLITESWQETIYNAEGKQEAVMRSKIVLVASQVAFNLANFQVNSIKTETMTHTIPGSEEMKVRDSATFDFEAERREREQRERELASVSAAAPSFSDEAYNAMAGQEGGEQGSVDTPF
ncbi:single-stranded DNA-binding protein [Corynebacterium aquatimens]|uniref:single-stranded DNA-binding protein n=1 Tax=Corynebacterium TaxID=1716 RepID=UPI001F1F067B|nr:MULTISPECIES: single-stranded DNA-binding protein [Corynebacterium]QYH19328.1 single-stranded DNA-binding protein [Corynebacterium aquatimens]UIZ91775.1 single-stranded DNA-binding protein [Corynebacterium sp. CNCTC7651]